MVLGTASAARADIGLRFALHEHIKIGYKGKDALPAYHAGVGK